jgi:hypothetical protein
MTQCGFGPALPVHKGVHNGMQGGCYPPARRAPGAAEELPVACRCAHFKSFRARRDSKGYAAAGAFKDPQGGLRAVIRKRSRELHIA